MSSQRAALLALTLTVGSAAALQAGAPGKSPTKERGRSSPPAESSCKAFVQTFYDRYLRFAQKGRDGRSCDLEIKARPGQFSRELRRRLAEDSAAQDKVKNEIVGLDGDPFLNAQDFGDRYLVEKVFRQGSTYRAEVYAVVGGKRGDGPAVVPELVPHGRGWMFVNFLYPGEKSDLLSVLKQLRAERQKGRK